MSAAIGIAASASAATLDLSTVTADTTISNNTTVTGSLNSNVKLTIASLATVKLSDASIMYGSSAGNQAGLMCNGNATTTEFVQGANGKWTLTTFAELANDALGADVANGQIKVYAADTVEGLESASPMSSGVTVKEKKSAVKTTIEVTPPSGAQSQFFKVKFE